MLYALTAILAGAILPRLENMLFPHLKAELSIDSAIALYSSIASGMMALTGIVFSLTFLMVAIRSCRMHWAFSAPLFFMPSRHCHGWTGTIHAKSSSSARGQ
jgi:hypothetical protein